MIDDEIRIRLSLSRSQLKAGLTLAIVLGSVCLLHSETITLTTLYPSPSGIYRRLITTMDTFLARDGGKVTIGDKKPAELIVNGKVGVGTQTALSKLDVNGNSAIGAYAGVNAAPNNGLIVSGDVGIGTPSPQARLDVWGEVKFGTTGTNCTLKNEGGVRYNSFLKKLELCNGSDWSAIEGAKGQYTLGSCRWTGATLYHMYLSVETSVCDTAQGEVMTGLRTGEPQPQYETHDIQCCRLISQ